MSSVSLSCNLAQDQAHRLVLEDVKAEPADASEDPDAAEASEAPHVKLCWLIKYVACLNDCRTNVSMSYKRMFACVNRMFD